MNTSVKQKKLDEEGGSMWKGDWGWRWGGRVGGGVVGSSVRCLSGLPGLYGWSLLCTCVPVPVRVCLCVCLSHSQKAWHSGAKVGALERGRRIQTNHWSFWQSQELSVLLMSRSLFLWVAGLSAALLPDRACIRASPGVCISKVFHCNWFTSLHTPTSHLATDTHQLTTDRQASG